MPDRDAIRNRLKTVFQEAFDDDELEIFDEMTAADYDEWDSVAHITLVLSIETEFGITLNATEVGGLENVGGMIELLMARSTG